jgi:hypothetical protein
MEESLKVREVCSKPPQKTTAEKVIQHQPSPASKGHARLRPTEQGNTGDETAWLSLLARHAIWYIKQCS